MDRRRTIVLAAAALSVAAVSTVEPPRADIEILTHERGDAAPARFRAVIDLGLASASLLVTWTTQRLR